MAVSFFFPCQSYYYYYYYYYHYYYCYCYYCDLYNKYFVDEVRRTKKQVSVTRVCPTGGSLLSQAQVLSKNII